MLIAGVFKDLVTSEVLLALQLHTGNEPLLPRLEGFGCVNTTADFIPFIPLFFALKTTEICIRFTPSPSTVMLALKVAGFPALYPHQEIRP